MASEDEWGPWIEHDGKFAPNLAGMWVEGDVLSASVERMQWRVKNGMGKSWDWSNWPKYSRIIRYRIRKPRGLTMLEQILADLPVPKIPA